MQSKQLLLASAMILLGGCASYKPITPACPAPPMLPALEILPSEVTSPSFMDRLDTMLFPKRGGLTVFDYSLPSAKLNTTQQDRR